MPKTGWFSKTLAIGGTVLVWLPVIAPVFFSAAVLIRSGEFHFDYLMPAELFPVFLVGGLLILWAALRARRYRRWIGICLALVLVFIVGGQAIAMLTGLATGVTEPGGWQWALVLGAIILYDLTVVAVGVGGILLIRALFRKSAEKE